jgi:hypothetical protein
MSEIETRADEIRGIAQSCKTINDLAKRMAWNMETARHANQALALGLSPARLRGGELKVGVAVPKPVKRK